MRNYKQKGVGNWAERRGGEQILIYQYKDLLSDGYEAKGLKSEWEFNTKKFLYDDARDGETPFAIDILACLSDRGFNTFIPARVGMLDGTTRYMMYCGKK